MLKQSDEVYTVNDLMERLKLTRRTILKYIKQGKIKAFRVGQEWRITRKHYEEFIENSMKEKL